MKKIVYLLIVVVGLFLGVHTVSATTDLELAEKTWLDKYWSVLQSDYDYYLFTTNSSNNYLDMSQLQSGQNYSVQTQYDICLFNDTSTVDVVKDYNQKITVSHCEKRYVINVNHNYVLQGELNNYTTTSVSFSLNNSLDNFNTNRYYKTNYFEQQNGEESTSINLDDIKPLFITIIIVLLLFFFVWLLTKAMGW